ncbi:ABC transporter substrate-binding protein [Malikia sp.]|uniref:ABC transporter substrate-binding protein n=1 Tax=Malikia sp. TaxID=2070706 RepID=UPI002633F755|nr:ABC transporter substrate-binding protein [Malikia sp.]MDD2729087.1 ABC transporter substrate-binding protein [Malikia sp.]
MPLPRALSLMLLALGMGAGAQTLDEIQSRGTLKVCIWPDYFGISWRNPHTGIIQGLDIDLSQALARDLGVRLEYVDTDFSHVLDDLEGHRCQLAMMAMGITPERTGRVNFSQPYLRSDVYAITTHANRSIQGWNDIDKPGRVVVVLKGTLMEPLMQRTLQHATLRIVTRPQEREREVESGRADVFIADYPYGKRLLMNSDWARLIAPEREVQLTDYAYAVPKGDPRWLQRINQFVWQIKRDGRLVQAARAHDLLPIMVRE